MKKLTLAILVGLIMVLKSFSIEPETELEPNWKTKYKEAKQEALTTFKPPVIGKRIRVIRCIGGEYTGILKLIQTSSVKIGYVTFKAKQLTPNTQFVLFADYYASQIANEKITQERSNYKERKRKELREAEELRESIRLEKERKIQERIAKDKKELQLKQNTMESMRLEREKKIQNKKERYQYLERSASNYNNVFEQKRNNQTDRIIDQTFNYTIIAIVIGIIISIPIFFLPTFIAIKRDHPNKAPIIVINLLLGGLFGIGWVVALAWSVSNINKDKTINNNNVNGACNSNNTSNIRKKYILKKK